MHACRSTLEDPTLSLTGTVIYAAALSSIGYGLGSAWKSVNHGLTLVGYILFALLVVAIIGFVVYRLRQFRREAAEGTLPAEFAEPDAPASPAAPRHGRHRSDSQAEL